MLEGSEAAGVCSWQRIKSIDSFLLVGHISIITCSSNPTTLSCINHIFPVRRIDQAFSDTFFCIC